jgi:hypothetical protein
MTKKATTIATLSGIGVFLLLCLFFGAHFFCLLRQTPAEVGNLPIRDNAGRFEVAPPALRARHAGGIWLLCCSPRGHMEKGQTFEVRIMLQNEKTRDFTCCKTQIDFQNPDTPPTPGGFFALVPNGSLSKNTPYHVFIMLQSGKDAVLLRTQTILSRQ